MDIKNTTLSTEVLAKVRDAFNATDKVAKARDGAKAITTKVSEVLWGAAAAAYAVDGVNAPDALTLFGRYCAAVEDTAKEKAGLNDKGKPKSLADAIGKGRERSWAAIKSAVRATLKAGYTPTAYATHGEAKTAKAEADKAEREKNGKTKKVKVNGKLTATLKRLELAIVAASGLGDAHQDELASVLVDALDAFDATMKKDAAALKAAAA